MQSYITSMTMAERLRTLMRWRGIRSQRQLARLSGVPQTSIHRILSRGSAYVPALSTITRLARALGTTVPWLSEGDHAGGTVSQPRSSLLFRTAPPSLQSCSVSNAESDAAELQMLMARLSEAERRHVVDLVRLLAERTQRPLSWQLRLKERSTRSVPISWRVGDGRRSLL
jgi:transcriptional regulator with XRE-family HTH domain